MMKNVFLGLVILTALFLGSNLFILNKIQNALQQPYMDEIFHIPQARHYCNGNYTEWNDKITTLPGLYLFSTIPLRLLSIGFKININEICSNYALRLMNVFVFCANFILLFQITSQIHRRMPNYLKVLNAFTLGLFPLNYFFQFLYYTDNGSTFFCLLAYYYQLKQSHNTSAWFGLIAVLYRQTNIIWIVFYLALTLLNNAKNLIDKSTKDSSKYLKVSHLLRFLVDTQDNQLFEVIKKDIIQKNVVFSNLYQIVQLKTITAYLACIGLFGLFVRLNGGIVVGDRSNHEASIHLCQLLYFFTFSIGLSGSHLLSSLKKIFKWHLNHKTCVFIMFILCTVIADQFTYEHKFLLADNRHYVFYLWSKLYRRHTLVKYLMVFIYIPCIVAFYINLTESRKSYGWLCAYTVCLCACLIPQKLIEFRYFIMPYYIYRLNIKANSTRDVCIEAVLYSLVNLFTVYMFLNRFFYWPNSTEPQRFMW